MAGIDGIRFVVPIPSIYARPNPKFFGPDRGVTCLNMITDRAVGWPGRSSHMRHHIGVQGDCSFLLPALGGRLRELQDPGSQPGVRRQKRGRRLTHGDRLGRLPSPRETNSGRVAPLPVP